LTADFGTFTATSKDKNQIPPSDKNIKSYEARFLDGKKRPHPEKSRIGPDGI
jgi:hypothetical protein